VLERAIEQNRHAPLLVLTRYIEVPCYLEAMQSGALDYVEKPSTPAEVGKLVEKYLRGRGGNA
jgi:DNA-binding NtrC family response regulator